MGELLFSNRIAATFVAYRLAGHALVAETIFPALQLFNIVRSPLQAMPMQFGNFTDSLAAMRECEANSECRYG